MKISLAVFLLLFAAVSTARSQAVRVFGKVVRLSSTYTVQCTNVTLRGNASLLDEFVGKLADIRGNNVGSAAAPVLVVKAITRPAHEYRMGGSARIGEKFELEVRSSSRDGLAVLYVSVGVGFVPLEPFASVLAGTFLLDPGLFFYLSSGSLRETYKVNYPIPNMPTLVGLQVYTQAAVLLNRQLIYINSACRRIKAR